MADKVEHFEIPADDIARAQAFYAAVFGFEYEPWGEEEGMLRTGGGIDGDLHLRSAVPHPTVVITVASIEATVELIIAHGGELIGEIRSMSETARYAYVRDSEGNVIGVYDEVADAS
ncbi:VOC family protein [Homoserinibacter sp. YIM 151385]|uniref:VOC family protein n=1 Tax=Homoserinibacter sp. YIM 151385 TaxID=2985506 RepID=UPI0022F089F3|nr:VOC family protein [Homoserinibacter sp. YIM 151385]WBU36696.1 VOC family protein [Homoserinibacter sp. YIM 151385]